MKKKSWEPFRSCLLNGTANPAHFHPNWAGLAVLFSRQLLNSSQDFFFHFNILIFIYFFKYKTIETHARAFLPLNISAIGTVTRHKCCLKHDVKVFLSSTMDTSWLELQNLKKYRQINFVKISLLLSFWLSI